MARLIGVVRLVVGEVFARTAEGGKRPLLEGDRLFAGEQLQTGAGGAVAVRLVNGEELTLGRESTLRLNSQLLGEGATPAETAATGGVEQLQQAISAGVDPTLSAEPPAAGPGGGAAGGGGGTSFVLLSETAGRVAPDIGFPTGPQGSSAPAFPPLQPPPLLQAQDTPPAAPDGPSPIPSVTIEYFADASGQVLAESATLDEAGLPGGSRAGSTEGAVHGRFVVVAADGVSAVQVQDAGGAWVDVTAGGTVQGRYGTLTVAADGSWTYTLDGSPLAHGGAGLTGAADLLGESFAVRVIDGTGDLSPVQQLNVGIGDDGSRALDDVRVLGEGDGGSVAGNVLDNDLHANGQAGADGRSFAGWDNAASTVLSSYGTLTLNADGSYSFVLDNGRAATQGLGDGETRSESFTYRIQDGDGDGATATLTITISGSNDQPSLSVDPGNPGGAGDVVSEAGLPGGSAAAGDGEFASGSFRLGDADGLGGLQSLSINGESVALGQLLGHVFTGSYGTLTITGYDAATGVGSYVYQLAGPVTDGPGIEREVFTLQVSDGSSSSAPASIAIEIADDGPSARADGNGVGLGAAVGGNVLANDAAGADGWAAPGAGVVGVKAGSDTATPASGALGVALAGAYGTLTLHADGSYSYQADAGNAALQALGEGQSLSDSFTYSIRDADGDLATTTLTIAIGGSNDQPTLSVDPGNPGGAGDVVSEAGLPGGSAAAGDGEFASGSFRLGDADGLGDLQSLSINGESVALGQLVGHVFTGSYGTLTITGYDAATGIGSYVYQLSGPVTDGPGIEQEVFTLQVSDGSSSSAPASIAIEIADDGPCAVDQTGQSQSVLANKTNLLIIFDVSDSMNDSARFGGYTRLEAARQAILELIEQYEALGQVAVKVVLFDSTAQVLGSEWQTANQAIDAVLAIDTPEETALTNYDAALQAVMNSAWGQSGKLAGGENVAYFLSDGVPILPTGSEGISAAEEAAWIRFLEANGITVHALGMGSGVTAAELDPIAYDGARGEDSDSRTITDFAQLSSTLVEIVRAAPVNGNLTAVGGFGADGGHVQSVTVDGVTYTYDAAAGSIAVAGGAGAGSFDGASHVLTIVTAAGGRFEVDMDDGAYTYLPPGSLGQPVRENIGFVLRDNDGDTAGARLSLVVDAASGPMVVRDDRVLSNISTQSGADSLTIPKWALLANDTGGNSQLLTLAAIAASAIGGTVADAGASVVFTEGGASERDGGGFSYEASLNGQVVGTADVSVTRELGGILIGGYGDEILVGRASGSTLKGEEGNDILVGGANDDVLDGGRGNDILAGGAGDDELIGGAGNDTASYIDATAGVRVSLSESLVGQDQNTGGAGTDRLTGLENLIGSLHDDQLTGSADNNILLGLAGNDRLYGMAGDDVLSGGGGDDLLSGGAGRDTFVWNAGDSGTDRIADFAPGQDSLGLSDLLSGVDPSLGLSELATVLTSYLSLTSGASSTLTVNPDAGGPLPANQTIVLEGVDLSAAYGSTDQATIIHGMLDDGSLKVV